MIISGTRKILHDYQSRSDQYNIWLSSDFTGVEIDLQVAKCLLHICLHVGTSPQFDGSVM